MKNTIPVITIDGPSGVGKSTISKIIAKKLKWSVLESGKIYRFLAFLILNKKISIFEKNIIPFIKDLDILLNKNLQYNDKLINFEKISEISSQLASFPIVRKILLKKQRSFRSFPGLIAEGRDMGTVVFPDAKLKFFLDANLEVRVYRRILELKKNRCYIDFKKLFIKMKNRDERDQNRLISPLCIPKNAIILNSTYLSLSEVITNFMKYITKSIKK
ncbi:MAG: (d)CMP kinase [Buchnera aphidicola (Brevicoryne brassicae)]|uniref:Cytidylate kinase n=1 Tax=Buchnera aphidicola (Brevicoryne brassicae) TaxID=911343 RepID=A0AAJ5TXC9_9GAMM|nr:(d)CMP kinase [Buchnera aphidicola]QCI19873.1 (d)CMP kinase [Buchnera aphidicola (Brevicoryne brassicae)]WAI18695.1 MAG: (d)CMP kinase [Buchnera aphidicola (Brevicoryne brassicae)]